MDEQVELFCFELEASHWEVLEQELGKADAVIKTLTLASIEGIGRGVRFFNGAQ